MTIGGRRGVRLPRGIGALSELATAKQKRSGSGQGQSQSRYTRKLVTKMRAAQLTQC